MILLTLFKLQVKRLLRQPALVLIILALPLLSIVLGTILPAGSQAQPVKFGILLAEDQVYSDLIWEKLSSYSNDEAVLIRAESPQEIERLVAGRVWECGYIFSADLDAKIESGQLEGLITRVKSPGSVCLFAGWMITSVILEVAAPDIAKSFLIENLPLEEQDFQQIDPAPFFTDIGAPDLDIISTSGLVVADLADLGSGSSLSRGLMALIMFALACFWAVLFKIDLKGGFFKRLASIYSMPRILLTQLFAAMALLLLGSLPALFIQMRFYPQQSNGLITEVVLLLIYVLILVGFSFFLTLAAPTSNILIAFMPFLLVLAILLSPIFFDAGQWLKEIGYITNILPSAVYLRAANGSWLQLILYLLILTPLCYIIAFLKGRKIA